MNLSEELLEVVGEYSLLVTDPIAARTLKAMLSISKVYHHTEKNTKYVLFQFRNSTSKDTAEELLSKIIKH